METLNVNDIVEIKEPRPDAEGWTKEMHNFIGKCGQVRSIENYRTYGKLYLVLFPGKERAGFFFERSELEKVGK